LKCEEGEPGIITWTPDRNTPSTVYYQCFTHRYLGWKINVLDSCDNQPQASDREEVVVDFEAEPSIRHESKIFPSENFLKQHEKDLIKHHNMNGSPPKITAELQNTNEFNKLIKEGIKTAEALEAALLKEQRDKSSNSTEAPVTAETSSEEVDVKTTPATIQHAQRRPILSPHQLIQSRPHFSSAQIPIYLKPPQSQSQLPPQSPVPPFYRIPSKLPPRRPLPVPIERRPPGNQRPYLLPQQSIQVNHYKKPPQPLLPPMRNYVKGKMPPIPQKAMPPVLLLGEPTEIKPFRKSSDVVIGKPSKTQIDLAPAFKNKNKIHEQQMRPYKGGNKKAEKQPIVRSPFKDPFNIRNDTGEISDLASNTGFKVDSIIVESGFRPIFRREDVIEEESKELENERASFSIPSISRRSDNDFHDVYEGEGQFFQGDEPQSFEPMFIPSPEDVVAQPLVNVSNGDDQTDFMVAEASERQSILYLPPNEVKRSAILDPLELKDPLPSQNDFVKLSSKTKKFIQNTPQFVPFLGELPRDLMLQINRESSASSSSSSVIKDKSSISTKLTAVKTHDGVSRK
jgi:hypothetical protein